MRPDEDSAPEAPPPGLESGSPGQQHVILATVLEALLSDEPR